MDKLAFVTGNINKGNEMKKKFMEEKIPIEIVIMEFDEPEINDINYISKNKVIQAYDALKRPCFVIDSGFNIYNYPNNPNYPGAFVHRSGLSKNIDKLLIDMKDVSDRGCQFLDCLTYYDGVTLLQFNGINKGVLTYEKRGIKNDVMRSDLWYVFSPSGSDKTLAEMTDEERNNRKVDHISAKEQFITWYRKNVMGYCKKKIL